MWEIPAESATPITIFGFKRNGHFEVYTNPGKVTCKIYAYLHFFYDEAWWPSGLSRLLSKPASASVGSNLADGRK